MREFQYVRCVCCGKLSRAKNYNLDAIHDFGIWIERIGGRGHITWEKRILSDSELDYLKQKFALQLEHVYFRLTGKKLDAENEFDEMEPVELRELEPLGNAEKMGTIKFEKEFVRDERFKFKNIGGLDLWQEKNLVEKVKLRNLRDVHF